MASVAGVAGMAGVARAIVAGATVAGAGVAGAGVARAGVARAGAARASVADRSLANPRIAKRRHLTSLQAESLGLLGTPSSIFRIRLTAFGFVALRISFQCLSGMVGIGKKSQTGNWFGCGCYG